ncbi:unnamed protein product [Ixodes persulcatus]
MGITVLLSRSAQVLGEMHTQQGSLALTTHIHHTCFFVKLETGKRFLEQADL